MFNILYISKAHINKRGSAILTFTCVHHTIVAVEKQKVLHDSMFLCVRARARAHLGAWVWVRWHLRVRV